MRPPDERGDATPGKGGATNTQILDLDQPHGTSEVEATRDIRDAACRLSLRAGRLGFVDFDDLLALVKATGRLCDVMLGGSR